MQRFAQICVILSILVALIVLPVSVVQAQTGWNIRINLVSTMETPDAMLLKVYFNLYEDRTGTPVLNAEATSAQIALLNTNFIANGEIKKPDIPIYVTLVMDASGSMGSAASKLVEAAKMSLNNSPDDSSFAVVQFDEDIKLLQDFTDNIPAVSFAIDQYKVSRRGTCLYDAAYTAVEAQSKAPPGRRAVILFTDGKDEKADGSVCSKHTYKELVDLATSLQVPIHTIGLTGRGGNINEVELENMSASTGGFSFVASQEDLSGAFTMIMDALRAQWMVEATIYPRQGENNAVLTLNLKDNVSLNAAFKVTSVTDYPGPPSPVTAKFEGLVFNPADATYAIQLALTSPDLVDYVRASVWDREGGSKVDEFVFKDPKDFNELKFATARLIAGGDYELRIIAVSREDGTAFNIIKDDRDNTSSELIHEFTFDPTAFYPQIEIQSVVQQENDLQVTLSIKNDGLAAEYEGWLINEATNTQVMNSTFKAPVASGTVLTVPMEVNKIESGKYTVSVRVLGANNQVFSSANYEGVVYTAKKVSIFEQILQALMQTPIILFSVVAIILVVVLFFIVNSMREKSLSGTPVMQGRLGQGMKGAKGKKPVIAVADHEPIASRSAPVKNSQPPAQPSVQSRQQSRTAPEPVVSRPVFDDQRTMVNSAASAEATVVNMVAPKPTLVITKAPPEVTGQGSPILLKQFPTVMGRGDVSLVIMDGKVSRQHAQITFDTATGLYYLTDLNSSNGTSVDGTRLAPNQPQPLRSGSQIDLGPNVSIRFTL